MSEESIFLRLDLQHVTANLAKAQRKGKVYVDYLRNVRGASAVGVYSTRAKEGAPVSVPVDWDELVPHPGAGIRIGPDRRSVGPVPDAQAARA